MVNGSVGEWSDEVLSRDENDVGGELEWKRIEEVFVRTGFIWRLRVNGQWIDTTGEHPFFVHEKGWLPAHNLAPGDLLISHDGQWIAVEELQETGEFDTVYNLRVADFHTYFVGSEGWGFSVWAHNTYATRAGGTGAAYDEFQGQGVYVLRSPRTGKIEYVGRGDAPTRLTAHAKPGSGKEDLVGEILFNNNLRARQAISLEQELQQLLGGVKSTNPQTPLRNVIQGLAERNPNFLRTEFAASDGLVIEALRRAKII